MAAPAAKADRAGYRHLALLVDDLGATLEQLAALGVEPREPPRTVRVRPAAGDGPRYVDDAAGASLATLAFVSDPDGNQIELVQLPATGLLWEAPGEVSGSPPVGV